MLHRRLLATLFAGAFLSSSPVFAQANPKLGADDPHKWLEEIEGTKALDWVKARNEKSLKVLEAHPAYAQNLKDVTAILTAKDRIPLGTLRNGLVYNLWQDEKNQRGLWRRTTLADYAKPEPKWEVLLDIDALGRTEKESWVWKSAQCLAPTFERCLIRLSRGGGDASIVREFDIPTKSFVKGGFSIPEAKSDVTWLDADTLLMGTDWGQGSLTQSGYPRIVKTLKRGQALSAAVTIYEGPASDVSTSGTVDIAPDGKTEAFLVRATDFFTEEHHWLDAQRRPVKLPTPGFAAFQGLHKRHLIFTLRKDWVRGGATTPKGSLIAMALDAIVKDPKAEPKIIVLVTPDARSAVNGVALAKDGIYAAILENVRGRIDKFTLENGAFKRTRIELPDNGTIDITSASDYDDAVFALYASFLKPDQLYEIKTGEAPKVVKQLPARFDSGGLQVQQFEATAKDGEKIPYFFVSRAGAQVNGATPTLIYAYGGFEISMTPWYWASAGRLWLEKGGAYAVANIRGGGEFGPRWHEAAKDGRRDVAFDDMAAVAADLAARKLSSPRRLGIMGGSNGGLLVGAVMVRNPALIHAVVCQVPLLDMIRYTQLSAGPSWIAEYGDPADPKMHAVIARWSPYQNLKAGEKYPEAFFMTSTKDDRVHPGHARKMAAKMEANGQPYFYYENVEGGHSAAADLAQRAKQQALVFTYLRLKLMD